jgi:hypothetical protein
LVLVAQACMRSIVKQPDGISRVTRVLPVRSLVVLHWVQAWVPQQVVKAQQQRVRVPVRSALTFIAVISEHAGLIEHRIIYERTNKRR